MTAHYNGRKNNVVFVYSFNCNMFFYSFAFLVLFGKRSAVGEYAVLNIWYGAYSVQSPGTF